MEFLVSLVIIVLLLMVITKSRKKLMSRKTLELLNASSSFNMGIECMATGVNLVISRNLKPGIVLLLILITMSEGDSQCL